MLSAPPRMDVGKAEEGKMFQGPRAAKCRLMALLLPPRSMLVLKSVVTFARPSAWRTWWTMDCSTASCVLEGAAETAASKRRQAARARECLYFCERWYGA